jgi:hypothetical protein
MRDEVYDQEPDNEFYEMVGVAFGRRATKLELQARVVELVSQMAREGDHIKIRTRDMLYVIAIQEGELRLYLREREGPPGRPFIYERFDSVAVATSDEFDLILNRWVVDRVESITLVIA